ncbi:Dps family protein [Angustibacter aerolatus]
MTTTPARPRFTIPGLTPEQGAEVGGILQDRLNALNDLALTLKHIHWNVVGQNFIAVHEMLDPQIEAVRGMVDDTAERMATMGISPQGTPGAIVEQRSWDDYSLGRATTQEHLGALDLVYTGVIESHRAAQETTSDIDPVTEDMIIGQLRDLELFHWFVRAHLENIAGELSTSGASHEREAADSAAVGDELEGR